MKARACRSGGVALIIFLGSLPLLASSSLLPSAPSSSSSSSSSSSLPPPPPPRTMSTSACPADTALVPGTDVGVVCIDRFEASVVDADTGAPASPNYNPDYAGARWQVARFTPLPTPPGPAHAMPLLLAQRSASFTPRARSVAGVQPASFVDRGWASLACANAGKRLCTHREWLGACTNAHTTRYPYGDEYDAWRCNMGQPWPPGVLGRSPNWQLLDPRLGDVRNASGARWRAATGEYARCATAAGVVDMVGNVAEIVADVPRSTPFVYMMFVGGEAARTPTSLSCNRTVTAHAAVYNDYSIGFRCCCDAPCAAARSLDARRIGSRRSGDGGRRQSSSAPSRLADSRSTTER